MLRISVLAARAASLHLHGSPSPQAVDPNTLSVSVPLPSIVTITAPVGDTATCEWSSWSECSVQGPPYKCFQTRTLTTSTNTTASSCNFQAGKLQSQTCPASNCPNWVVSADWSDCTPACKNIKEASAPYSGVQTRKVTCVSANGLAYTEDVCLALIGVNSKPLETKLCDCSHSLPPISPIFSLLEGSILTIKPTPELPATEPDTGYGWLSGPWGDCDTLGKLCVTGVQTRTVQCMSTPSYSTLVGDNNCDDTEQPSFTQTCNGTCIGCQPNFDFFDSFGFHSPRALPVPLADAAIPLGTCKLIDATRSCCNVATATDIQVAYIQFIQSLKTTAMMRGTVNDNLENLLTNVSTIFVAEASDTAHALDLMRAAIDTVDKSSKSYAMMNQFIGVLDARYDELNTAMSIMSNAVSSFQDQLSYLTHVDSSRVALSTAESFIEAVPVSYIVPPLLPEECVASLASIGTTSYCQACHPNFYKTYLASDNATALIPSYQCDAVVSACEDSLIQSYNSLNQGMVEVQNLQTTVAGFAATLQPLLATAWRQLKFSWLPGLAGGSGTGKIPDLSKLSCVNDSIAYAYPQLNNSQFCSAFLSDVRPGGINNQIDNLMMSGLSSLKSISTCDACIHSVILFLTSAFTQNTTNIEVSLPGYAQAVINNCQNTVNMPVSVAANYSSAMYVDKDTDLQVLATVSWANLTASLSNPPLVWVPAMPDPKASSNLSLAILNEPCTSHEDCSDQGSVAGSSPWWFCAAKTACDKYSCSASGAALLASGPMCARGPCMDGASQSFDGTCPDIAVCPTLEEGTGKFGPTYFSRFAPVMGAIDVNVCACAFNTDGTVRDQCAHAKCAAYASLVEKRSTCQAALLQTCAAEVTQCGETTRFSCTDTLALKQAPPPTADQCTLPSGGHLSTEKVGSLATRSSLIAALLALAFATLFF
jgi:Thrombospondin type 1 domain